MAIATMGFKINGASIPDPAAFSGAVSDLDTMGERDLTGLLHRNRVATKHHLKLEYHNVFWSEIASLCDKLRGDRFFFTYPDPIDGEITITAYTGDREWEDVKSVAGEPWIGNLSFSVIEY